MKSAFEQHQKKHNVCNKIKNRKLRSEIRYRRRGKVNSTDDKLLVKLPPDKSNLNRNSLLHSLHRLNICPVAPRNTADDCPLKSAKEGARSDHQHQDTQIQSKDPTFKFLPSGVHTLPTQTGATPSRNRRQPLCTI